MFCCSKCGNGKLLILVVVLGIFLNFSVLEILANSSSASNQSFEVLSSETDTFNLNSSVIRSNNKIANSLNNWSAECEKKFQVQEDIIYYSLLIITLVLTVTVVSILVYLLYLVLSR